MRLATDLLLLASALAAITPTPVQQVEEEDQFTATPVQQVEEDDQFTATPLQEVEEEAVFTPTPALELQEEEESTGKANYESTCTHSMCA